VRGGRAAAVTAERMALSVMTLQEHTIIEKNQHERDELVADIDQQGRNSKKNRQFLVDLKRLYVATRKYT
jgi:hypothetical protein